MEQASVDSQLIIKIMKYYASQVTQVKKTENLECLTSELRKPLFQKLENYLTQILRTMPNKVNRQHNEVVNVVLLLMKNQDENVVLVFQELCTFSVNLRNTEKRVEQIKRRIRESVEKMDCLRKFLKFIGQNIYRICDQATYVSAFGFCFFLVQIKVIDHIQDSLFMVGIKFFPFMNNQSKQIIRKVLIILSKQTKMHISFLLTILVYLTESGQDESEICLNQTIEANNSMIFDIVEDRSLNVGQEAIEEIFVKTFLGINHLANQKCLLEAMKKIFRSKIKPAYLYNIMKNINICTTNQKNLSKIKKLFRIMQECKKVGEKSRLEQNPFYYSLHKICLQQLVILVLMFLGERSDNLDQFFEICSQLGSILLNNSQYWGNCKIISKEMIEQIQLGDRKLKRGLLYLCNKLIKKQTNKEKLNNILILLIEMVPFGDPSNYNVLKLELICNFSLWKSMPYEFFMLTFNLFNEEVQKSRKYFYQKMKYKVKKSIDKKEIKEQYREKCRLEDNKDKIMSLLKTIFVELYIIKDNQTEGNLKDNLQKEIQIFKLLSESTLIILEQPFAEKYTSKILQFINFLINLTSITVNRVKEDSQNQISNGSLEIKINQKRFQFFSQLLKIITHKLFFFELLKNCENKTLINEIINRSQDIISVYDQKSNPLSTIQVPKESRSTVTNESLSTIEFQTKQKNKNSSNNLPGKLNNFYMFYVTFCLAYEKQSFFVFYQQCHSFKNYQLAETLWYIVFNNDSYKLFSKKEEADTLLLFYKNLNVGNFQQKMLLSWIQKFCTNLEMVVFPTSFLIQLNLLENDVVSKMILELMQKYESNGGLDYLFQIRIGFVLVNCNKIFQNKQRQHFKKFLSDVEEVFLVLQLRYLVKSCQGGKQEKNITQNLDVLKEKLILKIKEDQQKSLKLRKSTSQKSQIIYAKQLLGIAQSKFKDICYKLINFKENQDLLQPQVKLYKSKQMLFGNLQYHKKEHFKPIITLLEFKRKQNLKINCQIKQIINKHSLFSQQFNIFHEREFIIGQYTNQSKLRSFSMPKKFIENSEMPKNNNVIFSAIPTFQVVEGVEVKKCPFTSITSEKSDNFNERKNSEEKLDQQFKFFRVLNITNNKIYQGKLYHQKKKLVFIENKNVKVDLYEQICALNSERRTQKDIVSQSKKIEILLASNTRIMLKKYLGVDNSFEIYAEHKMYFFSFESMEKRNSFLKNSSLSKFILNSQGFSFKEKQFFLEWRSGRFTNFDYLMMINDYAGRSFNDISQYYIFPWVVINFNTKDMDESFIKNPSNFRDLTKPIGQVNEDRFQIYQKRYKEARHNQEHHKEDCFEQPYLYGIYHSNPAIVCNYLLRIQPFTSHHYQLQSDKFDTADRLFADMEQNWNSTFLNYSDLRELIPQFYFFPEFLRNRSNYKMGASSKKKQMINHVKLPRWVKTKTPQEFIFKLRKCLQSKIVVQNLYQWINLTFGELTSHQKAKQSADREEQFNVYTQNIYREGGNVENKEFQRLYFKEFGQIPSNIFKKIKFQDKRSFIAYDKIDNKQLGLCFTLEDCCQLNRATQQAVIQISKKDQRLKFEKQFQKYAKNVGGSSQVKIIKNQNLKIMSYILSPLATKLVFYSFDMSNQKQIIHSQNIFNNLRQFQIIELINQSGIYVQIVLTIRDNKLYFHQIQKSFLKSRSKISDKGKSVEINGINNFDKAIMKIMGNVIILAIEQTIFFFSNYRQSHLQNQKEQQTTTTKILNYSFKVQKSSLHFSPITKLSINQNQYLIFTLDESLLGHLTQITQKLQTISSFNLSGQIFQSSQVIDIQIHQLNLIVVLLNSSKIVIYNYYGDIVCNCKIFFQVGEENVSIVDQEVSCFSIFSMDAAQLVLGTTLGNIWKVDIFQDLCEPFSEENHPNYTQTNSTGKQSDFYIKRCQTNSYYLQLSLKTLKETQEPYLLKNVNESQKLVNVGLLGMKIFRIGRHYELIAIYANGMILHFKSKKYGVANLSRLLDQEEDD